MRYLSVCAGIEAATVAWHHMGWEPVAFSEIEKFPSAVLAHHYPNVPNWGDMTKYKEWPDANVDVLVGGTPCQSFSVAGLRKGLDDPRGNLMLTYLAIAKRYRPEWLVWENVPGVLSSEGGRDFAALLRGLDELGYGWAYRVLDAQYFGVAQRRRRVFVVGHLGNWQRAAAVLFERHSLSGHPAPSRPSRERTARGAAAGVDSGRWWDGGDVAATITTKSDDQRMPDKANAQLVVQPLTFKVRGGCEGGGEGYLGSEDAAFTVATTQDQWLAQPVGFYSNLGSQGGGFAEDASVTLKAATSNNLAAVAIQGTLIGRSENAGLQGSGADVSGAMFTLTKTDVHAVAQPVAFYDYLGSQNGGVEIGISPTLKKKDGVAITQPVAWDEELNARTDLAGAMLRGGDGGRHDGVMTTAMQVRRLTPVECERLQGFPDGYTNIPWRGKPESPDGPRYKALGNSMAVPVMSWIGERINEVSKL